MNILVCKSLCPSMTISSEQVSRSEIFLLLFNMDHLDNFWLTSYRNKNLSYSELKKQTVFTELLWGFKPASPHLTWGQNPSPSLVPQLYPQACSANYCPPPTKWAPSLSCSYTPAPRIFSFFFHLLGFFLFTSPVQELSAFRAFKLLFHNNSYYLLSCYYAPDSLLNFVYPFSLLILMGLTCVYSTQRNWNLERENNLPKVPQLIRSKAGI